MKTIIFVLFSLILTMDQEFANNVAVIRTYTMDTVYVEVKLPVMWIDTITAYSPSVDECDDSPFITANNDSVKMG